MTKEHISVLPDEVLGIFSETACKIFVDGTLGAGGHSEKILEAHPEIELLIGIDQDPLALEIAKQRLHPWEKKTIFIQGNFSSLHEHLKTIGIEKVNGVLLDIGVSSMQLDRPEKGFSFQKEGPLDMRMDPNALLSAEMIVNEWPEKELCRIFREYGEEKQWRAIARVICAARKEKPITTTMQLSEILMPLLGWKKSKGMNPLTLVFQGLRIAVNDELQVLKNVIPQAINLLVPQGRLAIISFHSLEDRIVKEAFLSAASDKQDTRGLGGGLFLNKEPQGTPIARRPIIASEEEREINPRCSSAKLRAFEKR